MSRIDSDNRDLAASYALCRAICRSSGSSFYPAFSLLSRDKAQAMEAIYAFCRFSDDLVDGKLCLDPARCLDTWHRWVIAALKLGDPASELPGSGIDSWDSPLHTGRDILPAIVDTTERFRIPPDSLLAVIEGVRMDLTPKQFETFNDLEDYCRKVASAVGIACLCVWGLQSDNIPPQAHDCGVAFQLTNILRDLPEDVKVGRLYLPREDFVRFGCSLEDLLAKRVTPEWLALLDFQIDRARRYYNSAAPIYDLLSTEGRRIFGLMWDVYWHLLGRIARQKEHLFERRPSLSPLQKLLLWVRWMVMPPARLVRLKPSSSQRSGQE